MTDREPAADAVDADETAPRRRRHRGTGRPPGPVPVVIDEEQLRNLATIGCTIAEAALILGLQEDTLRKRLKRRPLATIWHRARATGKMSLRRSLYQSALGTPDRTETRTLPDGTVQTQTFKGSAPNVSAQIWLSKQQESHGGLGFRDTPKDGEIDDSAMTLEDLLVEAIRRPEPERAALPAKQTAAETTLEVESTRVGPDATKVA